MGWDWMGWDEIFNSDLMYAPIVKARYVGMDIEIVDDLKVSERTAVEW